MTFLDINIFQAGESLSQTSSPGTFGTPALRGCCLAPPEGGGSQISQARAWASADARHLDANWPHGPSLVEFRHHWFSLSLADRATEVVRAVSATPGLLPSLKRRRLRQPSPPRRIAISLSPEAYGSDLPTIGRRRTSPVMDLGHCLKAATRNTWLIRRD